MVQNLRLILLAEMDLAVVKEEINHHLVVLDRVELMDIMVVLALVVQAAVAVVLVLSVKMVM